MQKNLSNKEIKALVPELEKWGFVLDKKDNARIIEKDKVRLLEVNGKVCFWYFEKIPVPTLKLVQEKELRLRSITVDMGAVKFVTSGADIMRPGITEIDEGVLTGEVVAVREETHGKALALGKVMYSGDEMKAMGSGKVVKNIHYVGDWIWNNS